MRWESSSLDCQEWEYFIALVCVFLNLKGAPWRMWWKLQTSVQKKIYMYSFMPNSVYNFRELLRSHYLHNLYKSCSLYVKRKWKPVSCVCVMEFSRPESWSGRPFPPPGDLPNPGIEPRSPALQADSLPAEPQGKPKGTGVGSLSLLQGIFPTQELNPVSPALQADSLPTEPDIVECPVMNVLHDVPFFPLNNEYLSLLSFQWYREICYRKM